MSCSSRVFRIPVAALCLYFVGCGSSPVPAPTAYEVWKAKDDVFTIQYPADWEAEGGGKQGTQWAEFTKGDAKIQVSISLAGSLIGDIAGNSMNGEMDESLEAVTQVHELRKDIMAEEFGSYEETGAANLTTFLGRTRKAEFTASAGLGGKLHGYHVTALGRDYSITVLCTCPESNWAVLQPAFDKIIKELK